MTDPPGGADGAPAGAAPTEQPGALAEGAAALRRADWETARDAYRRAVDATGAPEAREGLGLALWFLGEVAEGIAERERAFAGYVAARRCSEAARTAVWVAHQHDLAGRASAARGWLARAERALAGAGTPCVGQGWVAVERARRTRDVHEQAEHAGRALDLAGRLGDGDLEVFALSLLGRATAASGRREAGLALMEEAMAAAAAGRVRDVHTLAEAYCTLIEGCVGVGEWERGSEWCGVVERFARAHRAAPLVGACQTIHADVLLALGDWPAAERALLSGLAAHAGHVPRMAAPTVAALAELRVLQGRLGEAEELLAGHADDAASLRALAALRLAEDRPAEAVEVLRRSLLAVSEHPVRAAHLLGPLVQACLARDDQDGAEEAARRLSALADTTDVRTVRAAADLAAARVEVAAGRSEHAAARARSAAEAYGRARMPFAEGLARLELARAAATGSPVVAADEARAARDTFHGLGAVRAEDAAAALLRRLGRGTPPRPRSGGGLTAREREVLDLLGLGMSNARIATALVISEKTVGHHVSHVLAKLGASNRTEAVALAARAGTPA